MLNGLANHVQSLHSFLLLLMQAKGLKPWAC